MDRVFAFAVTRIDGCTTQQTTGVHVVIILFLPTKLHKMMWPALVLLVAAAMPLSALSANVCFLLYQMAGKLSL